MNFKEISIYTLIPEIYKIINDNNTTISNYFDVFYDNATFLPGVKQAASCLLAQYMLYVPRKQDR